MSLAAGAALASGDDNGAGKPGANWLTIPQVTEKLSAEGYQVRDVRIEGKTYEAKMIDRDGHRVEAKVDPLTGSVLGNENGEGD
jgi:hypothetical protein